MMPNRRHAALSPAAIRSVIDCRRLTWIRPLVSDYAEHFAALASLFAGDPSDPEAWRATIARVQPAARNRALMADVLGRQLETRGAPAQARRAAESLGTDATVAVVTGQQAGAFGGPLYTVLKAVTAIQVARRVQDEQGVPAVPVFWVDAEDHDWVEVASATVLDRKHRSSTSTLHSLAGAGTRPVGSLVLDDRIDQTLSAIEQVLAPTEFTDEVCRAVRNRYRPGTPFTTAFAGWIEDLLGRHGLVVFESADASVKLVLADLFVRELQTPAHTSGLVRDAGAVMQGLGHAPQLEPAEDSVNLFYLDATGRRPIKRRGEQYLVGDALRSVEDLSAEAAANPERFSPNVALRPLVQDCLFPTICYVAGPSELAYLAQLGGVYKAFGVEAPLLLSRASATLLDSASARFLDRHDVAFETLQAQDESALNHLLESQLPPSLDRAIHDAEEHMADRTRALRESVAAIDPTLTGAVDTTFARISDTLRTLHDKIVHASKKKDETLRRQFTHTRELAFPDGHPQERVLNAWYFANRAGLGFADRLIDTLPRETCRHLLLTL